MKVIKQRGPELFDLFEVVSPEKKIISLNFKVQDQEMQSFLQKNAAGFLDQP